MRFLVFLRLGQAVRRIAEISAAILQVGVEEEAVEPFVEVVMMRDVAA